MPQYAPDLMDYLREIGDRPPTEILENPDLLRRALSNEAPFGLVSIVAQALENVDQHPVVTGLSTYERGRVMSALGRRKEAADIYRQALETCTDIKIRGLIMTNLANDVSDPKEKEALLRLAIEREHYDDALVPLGMFLYYGKEQRKEGLEVLAKGVSRGVRLGVPVMARIICATERYEDLYGALDSLINALAKKNGIRCRVDTEIANTLDRRQMMNYRTSILNLLIELARASGIEMASIEDLRSSIDQLTSQELIIDTQSGRVTPMVVFARRHELAEKHARFSNAPPPKIDDGGIQ